MLASASASTSRRRAHTGVWGSVCRRDSRAAKGGRAAWCRAVGEPRAMHLACRGPARQAPSEPAVSWPGWSWVRSLGWLQLSVVARRRGPGSRSSLLGVRVSLRQPPKHRASFGPRISSRLHTGPIHELPQLPGRRRPGWPPKLRAGTSEPRASRRRPALETRPCMAAARASATRVPVRVCATCACAGRVAPPVVKRLTHSMASGQARSAASALDCAALDCAWSAAGLCRRLRRCGGRWGSTAPTRPASTSPGEPPLAPKRGTSEPPLAAKRGTSEPH